MLARAAACLCLLLGLAVTLPTIGFARTLTGPAASAAADAAARHFASVQTLAADFDILTPSGVNKGKIFVDRALQAIRVEFAPPLSHLVLVDGPKILFFGGDGTQVQTATSGTPFAFLMDPEKALAESVDVLQVVVKDSGLTLALAERGKKQDGQIVLNFTASGAWRLMEWGMFGKDGSFSQTKLRNVRTGTALDSALFKAPASDRPTE